ncbi:MAG: MMPL family transporter [Geminicoccaceae bacterium]
MSRAIVSLVASAVRHARLVVLLTLALSVLAGTFAASNLGIQTSTGDLIERDLPYRRDAQAFKAAFPNLDDLILAVVDGPNGTEAAEAATALADGLENTPAIASAEVPFVGPFFDRNGLLYLSVDELSSLADQLAAAQPFLSTIAQDPTLRGLFGLLARTLENPTTADDGGLDESLEQALQALTTVVEAQARAQSSTLDWRSAIGLDLQAQDLARRFVLIKPRSDEGQAIPARNAIDAVEQAVSAVLADRPGIDIRLTGEPVLDRAELRTVARGAGIAGILSVALVTTILILGLGSGRAVIAVLLTLFSGLVLTIGFAALAIGHLNLISVAFAVPFLGLAVDFGIHFALRAAEERRQGNDLVGSLETAAATTGPPLALAALCALFGFFAFIPTDYRGLAELGVISGTGMVIAWLCSMTILPAMLHLLAREPASAAGPGSRPVVAKIGGLATKNPVLVLGVASVLAVGSLVVAPRAVFDLDPLSLQDPELEPVAAFRDLADDPRTTPYRIDILAEDVAAAGNIAGALRDLPTVGRATTLGSFVPSDQDLKLEIIDGLAWTLSPLLDTADPPAIDAEGRHAAIVDFLAVAQSAEPTEETWAELDAALRLFLERQAPESVTGAAALARLETGLVADLVGWIEGLTVALEAEPITLETLPPSLRDRWIGADGSSRVEVIAAEPLNGPEEMRLFADAVRSVVPVATGAPVILSEASHIVINAFIEATAIASVAIVLLLVLVYRTAVDVVFTLTPVLLAALMMFAAAAILGLSFNFANIIVLPLLMALGVSGGIQIVGRHRQFRQRRSETAQSLMASSTPRAVLLSALTTIASFGSLSISAHRGTASMGQLLTVAILVALFTTLVVLPALLSLRDRRIAA